MIFGTIKLEDIIDTKETGWLNRVWFTSDNHFSHANILKWMKDSRPYPDVGKMDNDLLRRYNNSVGKDDIVFHLGDLTLGHMGRNWLRQMKGKIYFCYMPTHHDKRWITKLGTVPCSSSTNHHVSFFATGTILEVPFSNGRYNQINITLNHYATDQWEGSFHQGNWQLHGHYHGTRTADPNHGFAYDVGVDVNNLAPISLAEIINMGNDWELGKRRK